MGRGRGGIGEPKEGERERGRRQGPLNENPVAHSEPTTGGALVATAEVIAYQNPSGRQEQMPEY